MAAGHEGALGRTLDALRRGTGVLLTGVTGSGTDTLAEDAVRALGDDGWPVLRVPGRPGVRGRPLAALQLAGLGPRPAAGDPLGPATAHVRETVGTGPAVLLAHRADLLDEESRAVLAAVVEQGGLRPLLTSIPARAHRTAALRTAGALPVASVAVPAVRFDDLLLVLHDELGGPVDPDTAARVYALSGGLPGVARAVVAGARRAGHLVVTDAAWTAVDDLRTPELAAVVDALLDGLDAADRAALETLVALGTASPGVARRAVAGDRLAGLEDAGLLRLVDAGGRTEVAVVPPLLAEHLSTIGGLRGMQAMERVEDALGAPPPTPARPEQPGVDDVWAAAREDVAVLGRRLRRAAATRLAVRRAEWDEQPSGRTAVALLDALAVTGATRAEVDAEVARTLARVEPDDSAAPRAWYARYLGLARGDAPAAREVLAEALDVPDPAGHLAHARARLDLVLGDTDVARGVEGTAGPAGTDDDDAVAAPDAPDARTGPETGWAHLVAGRVLDALEALPGRSGADTRPADEDRAARGVALVLAGRMADAEREAGRDLDQARADLDGPALALSAYVVAFAQALAGRSQALREHLPGALAAGAAAPLQPWARVGLLTIGAALAARDGRAVAARSMAEGARALGAPAGPVPLTSPTIAMARVAVVEDDDVRDVAAVLWAEVEQGLDRGFVAAAVLTAAAAAEVLPDHPGAARAAAAAAAAQGPVLPALGRYVTALASARPEELAAVAPDLLAAGLRVHTVRASARAALLHALRDDPDAAQRELAVADAVVADAGGDLDRALDTFGPVSALTPRELQIARLVAGGASNREVAEELHVSVRTVDNHLYRIYRKVGVTDREALARRID